MKITACREMKSDFSIDEDPFKSDLNFGELLISRSNGNEKTLAVIDCKEKDIKLDGASITYDR